MFNFNFLKLGLIYKEVVDNTTGEVYYKLSHHRPLTQVVFNPFIRMVGLQLTSWTNKENTDIIRRGILFIKPRINFKDSWSYWIKTSFPYKIEFKKWLY